MLTEYDEPKLSRKQIEKVIKKAISAFQLEWKPDNTTVRIPFDKKDDHYIEVTCFEPFSSIKSGQWKVGLVKDGEMYYSFIGPSLLIPLELLADKKEEPKYLKIISTSLGSIGLTGYQISKIKGYMIAVEQEGFDLPVDLKVDIVSEKKKSRATLTLMVDRASVSINNKKVLLKIDSLV